jgi:2-dehydro-3-deoxyphosphogluconate aldolase / (4S)-4-hydroxy-2-oxoglutarate aldolase
VSDDGVLELLCAHGVVPVLVADELAGVSQLGEALRDGGLPLVEVTFRTPAAVEALRLLARDAGLLVGAGTVVRPEQVDAAHAAGARFVVTPGFSPRVVDRCRALALPVVPGIATATELIAAADHGIDLVKFFPAEAGGGVAMVRALHGPFPGVRFIPTGGIDATNAPGYLAVRAVAAVGGSWMVAPTLLRDRDFASITRLAAEAVQLAVRARP